MIIIVIQEVSPIALQLVERVLENCATKLQPYLVQAVKTLGISVDDSKILAKICQDASDSFEKNDVCVSSEHVVSYALAFCQLLFEVFHYVKFIIEIVLIFYTFFQEDKGKSPKQSSEETTQVCFLVHFFILV